MACVTRSHSSLIKKSILQKCGMPQNNKMTSVPIVYDFDCDSNLMKNLIL